MRKCIDEGTLQAWSDGELEANAAADIAAHLPSCVHCREAAGTLEAENLILAQALSAEFIEAVPTERLRQRVKSAVASELQATTAPRTNGSWAGAVRTFVPSFRPLAYASIAVAILIAGIVLVVNLRKERSAPSAERVNPTELVAPEVIALGTQMIPEPPRKAVASGPSKSLAPQRLKTLRSRPPAEPDGMALAWQENLYRRAFTQLEEAIKAQAPLRPALRVEYEYNLAMIDSEIVNTRQVARKNPKDSLAAQSMRAAYQSKIDLMNQLAQARLPEQ